MKALVLSALVSASVACACGVCVGADLGVQLRTQTVIFSDLDLNHTPGVVRLYSRIRAAARQVCEPVEQWDLGSVESARRCARDALARAVRAANVPKLATLYAAISKRSQTRQSRRKVIDPTD